MYSTNQAKVHLIFAIGAPALKLNYHHQQVSIVASKHQWKWKPFPEGVPPNHPGFKAVQTYVSTEPILYQTDAFHLASRLAHISAFKHRRFQTSTLSGSSSFLPLSDTPPAHRRFISHWLNSSSFFLGMSFLNSKWQLLQNFEWHSTLLIRIRYRSCLGLSPCQDARDGLRAYSFLYTLNCP